MFISTLPDDIIGDVLSRLPVKSLMRLRCVSKSWRFLISHPHVIKLHLNRAIQDGSCRRVLCAPPLQSIDYQAHKNDIDDAFMELDFLTGLPDDDIEIVGSCNGLVCLVMENDCIILCNPSTRDFKELPKPGALSHDSLAYGLGYDSSVDDYKVVRAARPAASGNTGIQMEIFSIRSSSWRRVQDIHPSIDIKGRGAFSDGALHWMVSGETGLVIIPFELATEEFKDAIQLPDQGDDTLPVENLDERDNTLSDEDSDEEDNTISDENLDVLGGYLSIIRSYYARHEVWAMKEYGIKASWTKLFTIFPENYRPESYVHVMSPICLSKNGEVLMDVDGRELVMYNPEERAFKDLAVQFYLEWFEIAEYVVSLVSPHGNGAVSV